MTECGQRGLQAAAIREGCLEEEEMSVPAGWVIMGVHLSGFFSPPTDLIVLLLILSRAESSPTCSALTCCSLHHILLVTCLCPFPAAGE